MSRKITEIFLQFITNEVVNEQTFVGRISFKKQLVLRVEENKK